MNKENTHTIPLNLRVAIQGFEGSFHQEAAQNFFGKRVETISCSTFRDVVRIAGTANESKAGIMAIENTIAGSILPNYNLLQKSELQIAGEVYLQIRQHLLVNVGVNMEDIKEVHSHPIALLQCIDFLEGHSWKLVETEDTALSAKHIHQHKSKHIAAIAGRAAAALYNLHIIRPDVHTLKNNITRFLVLQRGKDIIIGKDANKASMYFETDHTKGSLARVLTKIAAKNINLSKIQSMPIQGSDFNYGFYADLEIENLKQFHDLIKLIEPLTNNLRVLGIYKKGKLKK